MVHRFIGDVEPIGEVSKKIGEYPEVWKQSIRMNNNNNNNRLVSRIIIMECFMEMNKVKGCSPAGKDIKFKSFESCSLFISP